jgi:putative hydrolase of the HAD superfamily
MNGRLRCIVFDMDDTLYLERDYVRSGFSHAGMLVQERFGVTGFSDAAWKLFLEGKRRNIFDLAFESIGMPPSKSVVRELVDVYRNHTPAISLAEDAIHCLNSLTTKYDLALISDGPIASQTNKARALDLNRWIGLMILTDKWGTSFYKPHPRAFLTVQKVLGADPSECLYVADNPLKDFAAPNALGWVTVRVRRHGGLHSDAISDEHHATYQVQHLTTLIDIVSAI